MPTESSLRLAVDPAWSWIAVALVVIGLAGLVWWSYRPRIAHLSPWRRRLLLGLRFGLIGIILLMLLRPELRYTDSDDADATIILLGDQSRSMTVPDMPGSKTRREALVKLLADNADVFETLGEDLRIEYLNFSSVAEASEQPLTSISPQAKGTQTAIGGALEQLMKSPGFDQVAAVMLLSDGAPRTVTPDDPRDVARRYGELGKPIYTIPFGGDRSLTDFDLSVEEILVDPFVYERKTVPISARVQIVGGAGREFVVRVLLEDRTGLKVGQTGPMKPVPATSGSQPVKRISIEAEKGVVPVDLSFIPPTAGEYKVAVEVEPAEGEVKLTNNRRETIINVQKGGLRVALFASPLTEQKFLRNVNTEQKIQLDFQPIMSGSPGRAPVIQESWFEAGKYDAYIIADVQARSFGERNLKRLAERIDEGAGLMMLGGPRSFDPGGWASTPIAAYLPVELRSVPGGPRDALNPLYHVNESLVMLPTRAGLTHYIMQLGQDNMAIWRSLPPLEGANRLRPKVGGLVEVLAVSQSDVPLLVAHVVGEARVMAFAGDTTYLWYLSGHQNAHQRFWRQVILWLTHKENDTDQPVWVMAEPRHLTPGQDVTLTYGARGEGGKPVLDANFEMEIIAPGGDSTQIAASGGAARNTVQYQQTSAPGDYWVRVAATREGNSLGLDGWTRFLVEDRDLELDNPAADPGLLNDLAELSGGLVVHIEEIDALLKQWTNNPPGRERLTVFRRTPLWDNAILLSLFVALIGTEWFLRKRFGLV